MSINSVANRLPLMHIANLSGRGDRYSVPVRPSQASFAQFRYISGIAAREGQPAFSLTRVHLLNSLISNLQARQSNQAFPGNQIQSTPEQTEALINHYSAELSRAVKATPVAFNSLRNTVGIGIVFQTSA